MKLQYRQGDDHLFALTDSEKEAFGWDQDQIIFSTRGPDGRRIIPTRQHFGDGLFYYGTIETMEPPHGVSDDVWASVYGSYEEPRGSLLI